MSGTSNRFGSIARLNMFHTFAFEQSFYSVVCVSLTKVIVILILVAVNLALCSPPGLPIDDDNPRFSKPIENVTVVLGRSATLECAVDNLGPYNKVAWLKMDSSNSEPTLLTIGTQTLFGENKYRISQNEYRQWLLHIKHVRVSDRGNYMCQVNAKSMISQVGFLDVQVPPIIIEERTSSDTTVDEHHRAVLRCSAKGYPRPKIVWRREDGQQINLGLFGGKKYSANTWDGEYLNISQVTRDDQGAYLCIASNTAGGVSWRLILNVNFRPKIRVHNQLVSAHIGSDVELECRVEAFPTPLITWINPNGLPVTSPATISNVSSWPAPATGSTSKYQVQEEHQSYRTTMKLQINSLSTEDFGSFKCLAKNTLGEKEGLIRVFEESQSPQFKNALSTHRQGNKNAKANSLKSRKSLNRRQQTQQLNSSSNSDIVDDEEFEEDNSSNINDNEDEQISGPVQLMTDASYGQSIHKKEINTIILLSLITFIVNRIKLVWL